jgi:hypothetical protein
MSIRELSSILLAAAIAGCGSRSLDVGSTSDGVAGAVWNGTLENAQLSNGSNRMTMTLSVGTDGVATGTVLLGDGALLSPPSDPNVGYPPGALSPNYSIQLGFFEGFPYTMLDGRLNRSKLTFGLADAELWAQWCTLQKSISAFRDPDGGVIYHCSGTGSDSDLTYVTLCQSLACDCSATACRGAQVAPNLTFDLTISGATADGTISGELGDHQVHFVRAK